MLVYQASFAPQEMERQLNTTLLQMGRIVPQFPRAYELPAAPRQIGNATETAPLAQLEQV